MMREPLESNGPDPHRGNVKCAGFHYADGTLPDDFGSLYQCCCCDPCRFVRPNTSLNTDKPVALNYCCRCVPRGFVLVFEPDDEQNECCNKFVQPMFYEKLVDSHLAYYRGTLFGVTAVVELGIDEYGYCVWSVTVSGQDISFTDSYTVDHDEVTCLSVPVEWEVEIEGPYECTGRLVLSDFAKAKIPYIERIQPYFAPWGNFIELYPPCGECLQICSKICVNGVRHLNADSERVEFHWFGGLDEPHGWSYLPPGSDFTERLYLVEGEYGECLIWPALEEDGEEIFQPAAIDTDRGCSCKLYEILDSDIESENPPVFTVRCGDCSCWDFFCGNCRCLPKEVCVMLIHGTDVERAVLTWNWDDRQWGGPSDFVRLVLDQDDNGLCRITPDIYPAFDGEHSFSCTPELITKDFDPSADILSFVLEDYERQSWLIVSSLMQDCARAPCTEATPCNVDCGGHPASVTITVHQWRQAGESSNPYPESAIVECTAHYWQTADYYVEGEGVKYSCGYLGWIVLPYPVNPQGTECCIIKVELRNGEVRFSTPLGLPGDTGCAEQLDTMVELTTEECDPYFGQSDVIIGHALFDYRCLGLLDDTTRYQVTITE